MRITADNCRDCSNYQIRANSTSTSSSLNQQHTIHPREPLEIEACWCAVEQVFSMAVAEDELLGSAERSVQFQRSSAAQPKPISPSSTLQFRGLINTHTIPFRAFSNTEARWCAVEQFSVWLWRKDELLGSAERSVQFPCLSVASFSICVICVHLRLLFAFPSGESAPSHSL